MNPATLFYPMPTPEQLAGTSVTLVMSNFLLMKLGGQITVAATDLQMLAHDYSGYTISFDAETEAYTLKLKVRPEEFPAPELIEAR